LADFAAEELRRIAILFKRVALETGSAVEPVDPFAGL
jgi:hypothetical protein